MEISTPLGMRSLALLGAFALAGCGGGDDAATCTAFAACGGDVVGTWEVQNLCGQEKLSAPPCTEPITFDLADVRASGSETFGADLSMSAHIVLSGDYIVLVPRACLTVDDVPYTCNQLGMSFVSGMDPDGVFQRFSCVSDADGCRCRATTRPQTRDGSGSYALQGNTIVATASAPGSRLTNTDYCVSGTTLTLRQSSGLGSALDVSAVSTVLSRR